MSVECGRGRAGWGPLGESGAQVANDKKKSNTAREGKRESNKEREVEKKMVLVVYMRADDGDGRAFVGYTDLK